MAFDHLLHLVHPFPVASPLLEALASAHLGFLGYLWLVRLRLSLGVEDS